MTDITQPVIAATQPLSDTWIAEFTKRGNEICTDDWTDEQMAEWVTRQVEAALNITIPRNPAPAPTQTQPVTPQPAKPEPTKFQVLAITTAYEQGVGKGQQSRDVKNPYAGYCAEAWQLGYAQGQENKATPQPVLAPTQAQPAIEPAQNSEGGLFKREPLFATPQPARMLTDEEVKQCYMCDLEARVSTRLQEKFAEINGITLKEPT